MQVIFDLYARSVVTSTAVRAARSVAAFNGTDRSQAEATARSSLGGYASRTSFTWEPAPPDEVWLRVRFHNPSAWHLPWLDNFDRTVKVRAEHIVCPSGGCTTFGGT